MRSAALLALVLLALAVPAVGCGGDDDEGAGETTEETTTTTTTGQNGAPGDGCESVDAPLDRPQEQREAPSEPLDESKSYSLLVDTNCGSFTIALDLETAPNTAASLVALAGDGYFDDTLFHRIVPGFVIQGGDPTQSGGGGPGYSTVDPPPQDTRYTRGIVAMAKTSAEPPGTAGSQFFVVTAEETQLTPDYAVVGEVTEGIEIVELIGELGDPVTEEPILPVVVSTITVEES
jgi:peptidyl-prolyl cis-trans isomerase B (cyclophilin B)